MSGAERVACHERDHETIERLQQRVMTLERALRDIHGVADGGLDNSRELAPKHNTNLTKRQVEIVQLLASGLSIKETADKLFLSDSTIKTQITQVHKKFGVRNRAGMIKVALEQGLLGV